jgi:lipoprotein signal peptidase
MTLPTLVPAPVARDAAGDAATGIERRQGPMALGLLAAVVVLDQATKWWGWRHAPKAVINTGSTYFIDGPVGGWLSSPVSGPLLDLLGVGLLCLAGLLLLRVRRRTGPLVAGVLMIGGWGSNLFDRLGMHILTAPGSVRGAVDFIPVGGVSTNVADLVIIAATALYLVAPLARRRRGCLEATSGTATLPPVPPAWRPRLAWVAAVGFVVTVALTVPAATEARYDSGVHYTWSAADAAGPTWLLNPPTATAARR